MVSNNATSTYKSAQEIFAKKNKELYPNTLEALAAHLKESIPCADSPMLDDQRIRLYFTNVLPLLFDSDAVLQQKAIDTIDALLPHLMHSPYDQLADWPAIKDTITDDYCNRVNALRDRHNSNWHNVWSILVRIIHKDILRSATLINRYLSIVEQGFRNPNLTVRAEAFLCWRVLVHLFATHNELLAPKRIKLVCIPLKSSQSKTEHIAVNKFNVWWFLMSEVHNRLIDYTDSIVEPFLVFCFGPLGIQPLIGVGGQIGTVVTAPGKTFEKLAPLVVGALINLLGEPDEAVVALAERAQLLQLRQPFSSKEVFAKIGRALINSAGEASLLIGRLPVAEQRHEVAACLWRHVAGHVNALRCMDHFNLMVDNLYALENCITQHPQLNVLTAHIVHTIAAQTSFTLSNDVSGDSAALSNIDHVFTAIQRIVLLLFSATITYTAGQVDDVLAIWTDVSAICIATGCDYRELTKRLLKFCTNTRPSGAASSWVRFSMWHRLSTELSKFIASADNNGSIEAADLELVHAFLLMPIQLASDNFEEFRAKWIEQVRTVLDLPGVRVGFSVRSLAALRMHNVSASYYNDILAGFIELEKGDFSPTSTVMPAVLFDHIDSLCETTTAAAVPVTIKDLNVIVHAVNAFARRLGGEQLLHMYKRLKTTIGRLESTAAAMRCDRAACAEFRNIVQQHVRKRKATQALIKELRSDGDEGIMRKELLDMLNSDGDFVVIPSVWKFNPERLTDQQRDKMKERRADIPALYNDTSQSQESRSIKPWTPRKVVMPATGRMATPAIVVDCKTAASPEAAAVEVIIAQPVDGQTSVSVKSNQIEMTPNIAVITSPNTTTTPLQTVEKKSSREINGLEMDIVRADEYLQKSGSTRSTRNTSKRMACSQSPPTTRCSVVMSATERDLVAKASPQQRRKSVDSCSSAKRGSARKRASKLGNIDETESDQQENEHKPARPKSRKSLVLDLAPMESSLASKTDTGNVVDSEKSAAEIQSVIVIDSETNDAGKSNHSEIATAEASANDVPTIEDTSAIDEIENSQELLKPRLSARKTPTKSSANDTRTMDTLPMDTECAHDVPELAQQVDGNRIVEFSTLTAAERPTIKDAADRVLACAETESQASQFSTLNLTAADISMDDNQNSEEAETEMIAPTGELSPPDSQQGDETIRCSPEISDLEQRNANLLNDTQTISPIRCDSEPARVADSVEPEIRASSTSPPIGLPTDKIPVTDAIASLASAQNSTVFSSPSASQVVRLVGSSSSALQMCPGSPSSRFSQFKGRGAQLLNIIANKKKPLNILSDNAIEASATNATDPASTNESTAPLPTETRENVEDAAEPLPQPTPKRNLLTFSKTLPSPLASPSSSILKRKFQPDDTPVTEAANDIVCSTPVLKKKRVSFHDPPVSVTKEYIGHADEHVDRQSLNKLIMQQQQQQQLARSPAAYVRSPLTYTVSNSGSAQGVGGSGGDGSSSHRLRHVLRRKSRADSMVEFAKLNKMVAATTNNNAPSSVAAAPLLSAEIALSSLATAAANAAAIAASRSGGIEELQANTTEDMEPLQWNSSTASGLNESETERANNTKRMSTMTRRSAILSGATADQRTNGDDDDQEMISTAELDELIAAPVPTVTPLLAYDKDTLLQHVFDNYSLEAVLAKYASDASTTARQLTRELSALMRSDERVCRETLDELSENHSAQFLNHAIVENLGSTVCSQLAPAVLVEHLREVAKQDSTVRSDLCGLVSQIGATGPIEELQQQLDEVTKNGLVALGEQLKGNEMTTTAATATSMTTTTATTTHDSLTQTEHSASSMNETAMLERMMQQNNTTVSNEEMTILRKLLTRPMSDQQICDFMGLFSRNRKN